MKIAVLSDITNKASEEVKTQIETVSAPSGVQRFNINFELSEAAATAYTILMCAETCNNISRFDGVKYGHRTRFKNIDELYAKFTHRGLYAPDKDSYSLRQRCAFKG